MRIISVMTMIPTKSGFAWWPCEIDLPADISEADAMDEITAMLAEDGVLRVTKLDVEPGPKPGSKIITKRTPSIIGRSMIGTVAPLHLELIA